MGFKYKNKRLTYSAKFKDVKPLVSKDIDFKKKGEEVVRKLVNKKI